MSRPFSDLDDFRHAAVHDLRPFAEEAKERLATDLKGDLSWSARRNLGAIETVTAMIHALDRNQTLLWDPDYVDVLGALVDGDFPFAPLFNPPTPRYSALGAHHYGATASQAIGLAQARRLSGQPGPVTAFLTRDSIFNGQTFEAMNHAGHLGLPILMVFHDLSMLIGYKEQHIASFISSHMARSRIVGVKKGVRRILANIPVIGHPLSKMARRADESFVGFMTPGLLFEAFGFTYVGPINGSDMELLIDTFRQARDAQQPVFIHVTTPFDRDSLLLERVRVKSGRPLPVPPANLERMLGRVCAEEPNAIVVESQPMALRKLDRLEAAFPDRYLYAGTGLQHAATLCAGAASEGLHPILVTQADAFPRAFDSIIHDLAIQRLSMTFILRQSGELSIPVEHWANLIRPIPNVILAYPSKASQILPMLNQAMVGAKITVLMIEDALLTEATDEHSEKEIQLGEAIPIREGRDLTLVCTGPVPAQCIEAAERLAEVGLEVGVVEFCYLKPLDTQILNNYLNRPFMVVEPNSQSNRPGPLTGALLEQIGPNPSVWPEFRGYCSIPRPYSVEAIVQRVSEGMGIGEEIQNGNIIKLRPNPPLKKAKG